MAVRPSTLRSDHVAFDLLLEPGHAHLEELVEVRADDAEELQPLEQRISGSSASSSTRWLNSSQLNSRLMK